MVVRAEERGLAPRGGEGRGGFPPMHPIVVRGTLIAQRDRGGGLIPDVDLVRGCLDQEETEARYLSPRTDPDPAHVVEQRHTVA